jgi:hypothetical protein
MLQIGFFWTTALISAIFQVSVAGAIATWYFSRDAASGYRSNNDLLSIVLN